MENKNGLLERLDISPEIILRFQVERNVKNVFKHSLDIIEELKDEHNNYVQKLKASLPKEYHAALELANPFDANKLSNLRKRILTVGNDCIRNLEDNIKNLR